MLASSSYYKLAISQLPALLCLVLSISSYASQNGRNGFSGNPSINGGATCNVCHTTGAAVPAVSISGPTVVDAGTTNEYTVTITGGPAGTGGVNISVSDFAGLLEPSDLELHLIDNDLSHTVPKVFENNEVTFSFLWTAPEYETDVTLYAAGNSSNDELDLLGDGINANTLDVTVQNGTQAPPPEPPPPVGDIQLEEYVTGLNAPVVVTHADDQRLFVVERAGRIRIIDGNGNLLSTPFLDIANRVDSGGGEMGLLGLAFHPNYAANGYFYIYYTRDPGAGLDRTRVARFQVSTNPDIADAASERVIVEFEQPYSNHNGGDVHFGPDGYLYIASGDGGSGGDPQDRAQNNSVLLGKLLRLDVDGAPGQFDGPDCDISGNASYRVPPGNAFNDGAGGRGCDEIYASGLRNPWRFSFDRQSGDLWIADVGQGAYEEINLVLSGTPGGLDFGWRCYEGNNTFNTSGCTGQYFFPIHAFSHAGGNCSVTGGFVYRGSEYPALDGQYFFTDFCNTAIRTLSRPSSGLVVSQVLPSNVISTPSTFGEDVDGELYIASLSEGRLYRVRGQPTNQPPTIVNPGNQTNDEGGIVALSIIASDPEGDPLTYGATGLPSDLSIDASSGLISGTLAAASAGAYSVVVGVDDGNGGSDSASFNWTVNAPLPQITMPVPGTQLGESSATFSWTADGAPVTEWWVYIGSRVGARDLYESGSLGTSLSTTIGGLPTDGSLLYVRLWFRIAGAWQSADYQYTAADIGDDGQPAMLTPVSGSQLGGSSATFSWTADGAPVTEWWVYIGSRVGARDLYESGSLGTSLSTTIGGLPTDGSLLYVRLWFRIAGSWQSADYQYTAAGTGGSGQPAMLTPVSGSQLGGSSATFGWTADGAPVTEWWIYIGSSVGARDIYESGSLGTSVSATINGLPTDGSLLYVRLWFRIAGAWQSTDYQYTAAGGGGGGQGQPAMLTPVSGTQLGGSSATFGWTADGAPVTEWWIYIGSSVGARDIYESGSLGMSLSTTINGLPTDGSTVYVRLWFRIGGSWQSADYQYTAAN